jgi:diguanylate cyclase (GGDEF)-like protein
LLALAWFGYRTTTAAIQQGESAYEARRDVLDVFTDLLDQETGMRGFTATKQRAFLEPYDKARARMHPDFRLALLASKAANASTIEPSLLDTESIYNKWLEQVALPLVARPGRRDAVELHARGKSLMDRMRVDVDNALDILDANTASDFSRAKAQLALAATITVLVGLALCSAILAMFQVQRRIAFNDIVTGLPNRASFLAQTALALSAARTAQTELVIILFDLDGFKAVNDAHGHSAGDAVLRELAQRVRAALREADFIARIGGDEFTILLQAHVGTLDIDIVVRKIQDALSEPHRYNGLELRVSASIGVARYPRDGDTTEALLASADEAMYRAKRLSMAVST